MRHILDSLLGIDVAADRLAVDILGIDAGKNRSGFPARDVRRQVTLRHVLRAVIITAQRGTGKGHNHDKYDHYKPEHRAAVFDEAAKRVFPEALCTVNLIDAEIPVLCRYEILALYERGILLCRHHVEASSFARRMRGSITP